MQRVALGAFRKRVALQQLARRWTTRQHSTNPPQPHTQAPKPRASFERILSRTPKFLRPTLAALHNAPFTHITAFLILHEITAIVPLFGLAGAFHYYNWLPQYFAEGAWVVAGVEKFGRYFRRKGWIGEAEEAEAEREVKAGINAAEIEEKGLAKKALRKAQDATQVTKSSGTKWWNTGEGGVRLVVEFATAYAIVKALLPVRIVLSVWGAPWFARWTVIPVGRSVRRMFGR